MHIACIYDEICKNMFLIEDHVKQIYQLPKLIYEVTVKICIYLGTYKPELQLYYL